MAKVKINFPSYSTLVVDTKHLDILMEIFDNAEKHDSDYIDDMNVAYIVPIPADKVVCQVTSMTNLQYNMAKMAGDRKKEEK